MIPLLQNLPNPRYPLPINSADVKIHPNHSAILWIDGANPSTCFTTGFAVLDHGCVYPTRVRGMKLHSGSCNFEEVPFKVSTTEGDDLIVGALKHRGDLTYFYYVPADVVKAWKPPSDSNHFKEEDVWRLMLVTNSNLLELSPLLDTETAKLATIFGEIVKLTGIFKGVKKLTKMPKAALKLHALSTYTINMKHALLMAEGRERLLAKEIGDVEETVGAAADAKARFAALKTRLLSHSVYYDMAMEERMIECDGDDAIDGAKAFVANLPQADVLLEDIASYEKWIASVEAEAVVAVTPFKKLLEKDATVQKEPTADRERPKRGAAKEVFPDAEAPAPEPPAEPALFFRSN